MSRRQVEEMKALATRVAIEATGRERARCLWVLERLVQQAQKGLEEKLMTPGQEQMAKVRLELTKTIANAAKTLILSDARPQPVKLTPASGQKPQEPPTEIVIP